MGGRDRPRGPRPGHVTNAKLFSGAATAFGAEPNTQVSLVDAAMPGMLPVPNRECIRQAVRTGMALDAKINSWSRFDRKNYFYADLPQGYQISQLYHPLVGEGEIEILLDEKDESSAKTDRHRAHPCRAGRGQADARPASDDVLRRPQPLGRRADGDRVAARHAFAREAGAYLRKLRAILRYVGSCDGNMEEGSMRADVNVSVRKPGDEFGTRTETKNVNSVRFVMAVIEHEAQRQVELIEERRHGRPGNAAVRSRQERDALAAVEGRRARLSLLPRSRPAAARARRGVPRGVPRLACPSCPTPSASATKALGITPYNASVLTAEVETARWFDALLEAGAEPKQAANWVVAELFGALNRLGESIDDSPVSPAQAAELLALVADGTISRHHRQAGVRDHARNRRGAGDDRRGARASSRPATPARSTPRSTRSSPPTPTRSPSTRRGKEQLFGFFVGQTMKAMAGQGQPAAGQRAAAGEAG